jgi:hypothetical protein
VETRPPLRARRATGAAALVPAAALAVASARGTGNWTWPLAAVGAAGVALAAVALVRGRAGFVGPALILLAAAYGARLVALDPGLQGRAPLAAAALVAAGELAYLSIGLRLPAAQERGLVAGCVAQTGLEALGAALVTTLVLAAAGLPSASGAGGDAIGVAAAAVAIGLVAALSRRTSSKAQAGR